MYKEFCEELRLQFVRHNDAVESLEKKSKDLITVSGIIATLLMAFGKFIFDFDSSIENIQSISVILFVVSMVLLLITIGICLWANRLYFQKNPFIGKNLIKNDKLIPEIYKSWVKSKKEDFYEALSEEYALCLKQAETVIKKKAFRVTIASFIFPTALVLIPGILISAKWDLFSQVFSSLFENIIKAI